MDFHVYLSLCCGLLQSVLKGIVALRTTPAAQSATAAPLDLTSSTTVTNLLTVGISLRSPPCAGKSCADMQ